MRATIEIGMPPHRRLEDQFHDASGMVIEPEDQPNKRMIPAITASTTASTPRRCAGSTRG
jgi:hypothetical protein